jgi:tRNA(Ile)-lysidine synthase
VRTVETAPIATAELPSLFHDLENLFALVLAVSGGPDSTALMLLVARWCETLKAPPKLIAVTIDHGLRIEAKREAAAVAKLARKLKITHRTLRWTGKKPKTGLQQAAREARYRLLVQAARQVGARHILTAHTRDDQAETVLIRMCRGSGLAGLAAMQRVTVLPYPSRETERSHVIYPFPERGGPIARSVIGVGSTQNEMTSTRCLGQLPSPASGGRIGDKGRVSDLFAGGDMEVRGRDATVLLVRPLLDVPKSRLIATLKAANIAFAEDPSNRDPRFARTRLRLLATSLAAEGLTSERLAVLARRLRRADVALEAAVDRAAADLAAKPVEAGAITFRTADYMNLPAEIALRLLGRAVAQRGNEGPVELAKLEKLSKELAEAHNSGKGRFRRTLAGACVTLTPASILVERAPARRSKALRAKAGQAVRGREIPRYRP